MSSEDAEDPTVASGRAVALAALQRASARALYGEVGRARERGVPWRDLAATLDMPAMTLHRQFSSGRGVVAVGPKDAADGFELGNHRAVLGRSPVNSSATRPRTATELWMDGDPPSAFDRFVGRESELADLRSLFSSSRLVTLTGPPGVGKTRLALEHLSRVRAPGDAPVRWVDLAPLPDVALVGPAVAAAVHAGLLFTGPVDSVVAERCGEQAVLIVLDNCEHVVDGCADVVERLLVRCPQLRILATSREPLRVRGEVSFPVPPLPVTADPPDRAAAVRLFADRARTADPAFALTEEMTATVAEVCARLDGLPLAIELAARQATVLPPDRLLPELARRLDLLVSRLRCAPDRHRSLRRTIHRSYDLLDPEEQRVFRALSVSLGSFDADFAAALCRGERPTAAVWPVLSSLAAKSLLMPDPPGRFRVLESLRVFGMEKLHAAGEQAVVHEHLLAWAAELAEGMLMGTDNREAIGSVDAERHNLHHAVRIAEKSRDRRLPLVGAALALCWVRRGDHQLAQHLTKRLLGTQARSSPGRAHLESVRAFASCMRGDTTEAFRAARSALDLAQTLSHPELTARALAALSRAHSGLGEHGRALAAGHRQVAMLRPTRRALPLATALNDLAWVSLPAGLTDQARHHVEEALVLLDPDSAPEAFGTALHTAGSVALAAGHFDQAAVHFSTSLSRATADTDTTLYNLEGLAVTALATGAVERGLRLAAAAARVRKQTRVASTPWWARMLSDFVDRARASRQPSRTGATDLNLEEAIRYALRCEPAEALGTGAGLTRRESDVAELVAQGLTDHQIAARLHISTRSVSNYITRIRTKLDLPTRIHVATWVVSRMPARREGAAPVSGVTLRASR
ncbi:ATP-binding protein [Kitasatospora sp. NPDC057015]|uniref:ATP-binding protein n=1 Tax=Kitasatospora sp. NPDC057015 TaxID=3346001 RepID=UPI00363E3BF0